MPWSSISRDSTAACSAVTLCAKEEVLALLRGIGDSRRFCGSYVKRTYGELRIRLLRAKRSWSSRTVISDMGRLLGFGGFKKPGMTPAVAFFRRGETGEYLFIVVEEETTCCALALLYIVANQSVSFYVLAVVL